MPRETFSRYSGILAIVLPLICLAAPSIWLLASVPPLWRDMDAYVQVTLPPGQNTILLHGPLYCQLARVPLWLGDLASGGSMRFAEFLRHPHLSDVGVYFLLSLQHAALCFAGLYLLSALSKSVLVRTVLAIFFASNPMFYAYAHCVGSETLSMIEIVLFVGVGTRMLFAFPHVKREWWLLAGLILFCSFLTRHINCLLAAFLPSFFLVLSVVYHLQPRLRPWGQSALPPFDLRSHLSAFGWSILISVCALTLSSGYTQILCRKARLERRSEAGFTFLWRLDFLAQMPPSWRHELLREVSSRTTKPGTSAFFAFLESWITDQSIWDPAQFAIAARAQLQPENSKAAKADFDRILNAAATAFLLPPVPPLVTSAWADFSAATRMTEGDIARYLFATTEYDDVHRLDLPQVQELITFRRPMNEAMRFSGAAYFRFWDLLSFRGWSVAWLGLWALACYVGWRTKQSCMAVGIYAAALCFTGMLAVFLNCFFAKISPRFALPMMELQALAGVIILGWLLSRNRWPVTQLRA